MGQLTRRALLLAATATALPALAQEASSSRVRLRVADIQAADYPTVQALYFMDRTLRAEPMLDLGLQIFSGAQLGEEREIVEQTRAGAIDMARVNITCLSDLVPHCSLLSAPGLIRSDAHLQRVTQSGVRGVMASALEDVGLVLLAIYPAGARQFYARRSIEPGLAGFRNLSVSVQASELMKRFVTALGATPVELGFGQVLPALQAGIVDGAENTLITYVSLEHYIPAPYLFLTDHGRAPDVLLIARSKWQGLEKDQQRSVAQAAARSEAYSTRRWLEWTALAQRSIASINIQKDEAAADAVAQVARMVRNDWISEMDLHSVARQIEDLA